MTTPPKPPDDTAYCAECLQPCAGKWEDFGIGPYEFWGQKCCQVDERFVSACCEATVMLNGAEHIEPHPNELRDAWREDHRAR